MTNTVDLGATAEAVEETAPERLGALFDAHHARLYRLARRLSRTDEDARDLTQDTFVRAARAIHTLPVGAPSEEAWLVRVMVNLCRDGWRRSGVHERADARRLTAVHVECRATQEDVALARDLVWRALETLPPRQRAIVVLHELEDEDVADIARTLGIARVTVRWHLSAGRRALARFIRSSSHA